MGFSISWIAVHGKSKQAVLDEAKLTDTGEPDEACESPVCGAELPDGWYVLFLNDYDHPYLQNDFVSKLSENCQVIVCQVEEHVMASTALFFENGQRIWYMGHLAETGIYHLEAEGTPPAILTAIEDEQREKQDAEGGEMAEVDHLFEVPLLVAQRICGYRHDRWKFDWGEPKFTTLAPADAPSAPRSFLGRLFGRS